MNDEREHLGDEDIALYLQAPAPGSVERHVASCASCGDRLAREAAVDVELGELARACLECTRPVDGASCDHCGAARRLAGYQLEAILVRHGRGRLYLARDASGQRVAIKELAFARAPGLDAVLAFDREAKYLRQLNYPAIPRFVASFTLGEGVRTRMYLVQEYVEGESLAARLDHHQFSEPELVQIAREVLVVLAYLQAMTPMVFHRDIKPANVLRRADGTIAVVDFGAARDLGATLNGTMVGTFGYMPMEQLAGAVDATSDLYGLGMSLLHLATRTEPWNLDRKTRARAHVSHRFRAFVDRLTSPVPSKRFASAAAALRELDRPAAPVRIVAAAMTAAVGLGAIGGAVAVRAAMGHDSAAPAPAPMAMIAVDAMPAPQPTPEPSPLSPRHGNNLLTAAERAELDADIDRLAADEPAPDRVAELRALVAEQDPSRAVYVIPEMRKSRLRVAVPLLLEWLTTDDSAMRGGIAGNTLTALTGVPFDGPMDANRAHALVQTWWPGYRDHVETEPCKMSAAARRTVERAIAANINDGTPRLAYRPRAVDAPIGAGCAEMVQDLLSMADDADVSLTGFRHELVTLRHKGLADNLSAVALDPEATARQRYLAATSIADAAEDVPQAELLAIVPVLREGWMRQDVAELLMAGDPDAVAATVVKLVAGNDLRTIARARRWDARAIPALVRAAQAADDVKVLLAAVTLAATFDDGQVVAAARARARQLGISDDAFMQQLGPRPPPPRHPAPLPPPTTALPEFDSAGHRIIRCANGMPVDMYPRGCPRMP